VNDGSQAIVQQEPAAIQSQGQVVTAAGQPAEAHGIVSVKLQGLAPLAATQAAQGAKSLASSGKGGQLEPIAPGAYIALAAGTESSGASGTESGGSGDGQSAEEKESRPGRQTQENSAPSPLDAQTTRALVSETTAASSASSASNVNASVERAHLAQQLAKHIDTMRLANAGHSEMSLDLKQEHLGGLHLTVSSDANGVSARIVVETAQAQQAVDAAKDQLRAALENRGLNLASLDVTLSQGSSGGNSFAREQSSQTETDSPRAWRPDVSSTVSPLQAIALPRATPVRASREWLDYRA
jgi:flagellar hook-length control protein FliK